jgi:hypothetical protein
MRQGGVLCSSASSFIDDIDIDEQQESLSRKMNVVGSRNDGTSLRQQINKLKTLQGIFRHDSGLKPPQ